MSPSVWWRSRAILKTVSQLRRNTGQRIWLDIGTNESQRALPDVRLLKEALEKKGWREGENPGLHGSRRRRTHGVGMGGTGRTMLEFLFPRQP